MENQLTVLLIVIIGLMTPMNVLALTGWLRSHRKANEYGDKCLELMEQLQQQLVKTIEAKEAHRDTITEQQSSLTRIGKQLNWVEGLILQLPENHDGRNSWLLNHGASEEANIIRVKHSKKILDECSTVVSMKREEPALATTECKEEGCKNDVVACVDMYCGYHNEREETVEPWQRCGNCENLLTVETNSCKYCD